MQISSCFSRTVGISAWLLEVKSVFGVLEREGQIIVDVQFMVFVGGGVVRGFLVETMLILFSGLWLFWVRLWVNVRFEWRFSVCLIWECNIITNCR